VLAGERDMTVRELATPTDTCSECQRLDRVTRYAAFELTMLEAARWLRRSDPEEHQRFNSLVQDACEKQRQSQVALWSHVRLHSMWTIGK